MVIKIVIPDYRAKSRNKTITSHWRTYQKYRDEVSEFMAVYANEIESINPARVTIEAYYKGKRCVDTSNIDDKLFVDGLQNLGILEDDTPYENPEVIKRAYPEAGENKVIIYVHQTKTNGQEKTDQDSAKPQSKQKAKGTKK